MRKGRGKDPLRVFIGQISELDRVLHLAMTGLQGVVAKPAAVEALYKVRKLVGKGPKRDDVARSKREARFAKRELDAGFPILHAQATVALWGALEVLVEDLCVRRLAARPELLKDSRLSRLNIPLGRFLSLDGDERLRLVVRQFQSKFRTDFLQGPGMLEGVLDAVKLTGPIDPNTRKQLLELRHVRNIVVHRAWIVDQRLVDDCPWLGVKPGVEFAISHKRFAGYTSASYRYWLELFIRDAAARGIPRKELDDRMKEVTPSVPDVLAYEHGKRKRGRFVHAYPRINRAAQSKTGRADFLA